MKVLEKLESCHKQTEVFSNLRYIANRFAKKIKLSRKTTKKNVGRRFFEKKTKLFRESCGSLENESGNIFMQPGRQLKI